MLVNEKSLLLKDMHAKFHTVQQVQAGIKDLEHDLNTKTLSSG